MLTTGDIQLTYPIKWPGPTNITSQVGGAYKHDHRVLVNNLTGLFTTGVSAVPGGSDYYRYAKVFFAHSGTLNEYLTNPLVYIGNESVSDQLAIAPDPYWLRRHVAQTGCTNNITAVPDGLSQSEFSGYTVSNPMNISVITGSTVIMNRGDTLGVWVRLKVPGGLPSNPEATFNLGLNGQI